MICLIKTALTIAASDSISGAGIQADLRVFRDLGVYGVCAVTNVTSQSTKGVDKIFKVPPTVIASQIDNAARDLEIGACKIGMLFFRRAVETVADRIKRRNLKNIVLDTPLRAKNGERLTSEKALKRVCRVILPLCDLVTPNLEEIVALTGKESAEDAAKALMDTGCKAVLVKGGHRDGDPVDYLFEADGVTEYPGRRIAKNMHGTGCALSAAVAAGLAKGYDLKTAVGEAKTYVAGLIEKSEAIGKGSMHLMMP
ncbi:MAG: bifunctional hydroxymethylpyrimidine kinase/phosphomethylpyrimidine kinase [Abditibacteriota bacterium]|nr:bifunctional hydroxymethylpyrimidine kinase/phosphomethylpyrimidine kinase [Abditibacteriota bacterium]